MAQVSRWGDWPGLIALGLAGALIAYALGNRRWLMICAAMIIACALAGLVNRVIKVSTGRARPSVTVDAGWNGPRWNSKYHAFPSGHTASAVAFFVTLLLARRRVGLIVLPVAFLIAASRIYLRAHFLSDVTAGALVGALCAVVTWRVISANMLDTRPHRRALVE